MTTLVETKVCTKCQAKRSLDEFYWNSRDLVHSNECKICTRRRTSKYLANRTPDQRKKHALQARHKLSLERYTEMYEAQQGHCLICGEHHEVLHIDHDHNCCSGIRSCGKCVRGLLCRKCNTGIGFFKDDPDLIERAITYLRSTEGVARDA